MTVSLNNALSGLRVSQEALDVISQNIANANNPTYTEQVINQSAVNLGGQTGDGVTVDSISRQIDGYITQAVVASNSTVSAAQAVSDSYTQLQLYIGQPGQSNSLDTYVDNFFNAASQLAVTSDSSSLKTNAVAAGQTLASQISSLASNVETLRYNADTAIGQSVTTVNSDLSTIYKLNSAIQGAQSSNESVNGLEDTMDATIKDLANQMDITYSTNSDGTVSVSTTGGVQLVGNGTLSALDYTPASSASDFSNNQPSGAIKVYQLDSNGNKVGTGITIVSGGTASQVTSSITGGTIAGLLQIRDQAMPNVLSQLDNIASSLTSSVNAISNNGVGFPPPQSLTGTTLVSPTASTQWNGSVMIAALDSNGDAVASPYASDTNGLAPLTLNLGALNSSSGAAGQPSYQTIINQINQYYGPPQPRATMADLSNIQLVANSDSLTAGAGTFNFSVNLSNLSANNSTFQVTGATISGGAAITSPASFPSASVTATAGATTNTNGTINLSADMSAAGPGPYTVTLQVQTTNSDGSISNGTVTYTLNNATSGLMNNNYNPATATGAASIEQPTTNQPVLVAKLVDANGNEIAKDPATGDYVGPGYLEITGVNSNVGVGISELDSSEQGNVNAHPPIPASDEGFSQYMGLNNFFVDTGSVSGSALSMAVNSNIVNNPQNMSVGQLTQSPQPSGTAQANYTYSVGSGSNQSVDALATLGTQSISFDAAGGLPESGLAFSDYAAAILGDAASKTSTASSNLSQTQLVQQGFVTQDQSVRGVNVDDEMANTILYQNAYSANARVITVTNELFTDLLDVFQ